MFKRHEAVLMNLISDKATVTNQHLDALSRDISDLKESLQFTQDDIDKIITNFCQPKDQRRWDRFKWNNRKKAAVTPT